MAAHRLATVAGRRPLVSLGQEELQDLSGTQWRGQRRQHRGGRRMTRNERRSFIWFAVMIPLLIAPAWIDTTREGCMGPEAFQ